MKTTAVTIAVTAFSVVFPTASHADPIVFPNLGSYTPVNPQDYVVQLLNPGRPYPLDATHFLTPDGIICTISLPEGICLGNNFPNVPPASPATGGGPRVNAIATDHGVQPTTATITMDPNHPYRTLPPFHSITVNGVTCGVDDAKTTACKDSHGQGFVLSPNGSGWLPHV